MNEVERNREYWNDIADAGANASVIDPKDSKGFKNQYIASIRDQSIVNALDKDASLVLDFGCGTGGLVSALCRSGREVIGIDISIELLKLARSREYEKEVLFVEYSGFPLPVADNSVDVVVVYVVFAYMVDDDYFSKILTEIHRVLKPQGQLLVIDQSRRKRYFEQQGMKVQRPVREFENILERKGFSCESSQILRYGRFVLMPLIKFGWIPNRYFSLLAKIEKAIGRIRGLPLKTDYVEVLYRARVRR